MFGLPKILVFRGSGLAEFYCTIIIIYYRIKHRFFSVYSGKNNFNKSFENTLPQQQLTIFYNCFVYTDS